MGIRPEHLVEAYNGLIKFNVDLVEKLGSDNLVYGEIKGKKDLLCYRTPGNEKINHGSAGNYRFQKVRKLMSQEMKK